MSLRDSLIGQFRILTPDGKMFSLYGPPAGHEPFKIKSPFEIGGVRITHFYNDYHDGRKRENLSALLFSVVDPIGAFNDVFKPAGILFRTGNASEIYVRSEEGTPYSLDFERQPVALHEVPVNQFISASRELSSFCAGLQNKHGFTLEKIIHTLEQSVTAMLPMSEPHYQPSYHDMRVADLVDGDGPLNHLSYFEAHSILMMLSKALFKQRVNMALL